MPGGRASKSRGDSFEYRVRNWFKKIGWDSERNPLSGASEQLKVLVAKHDVRASKNGIFLQVECKKTAGISTHKLQRIWYEKIDFRNDEFLAFAFGRSPIYCIVPLTTYQTLFPDAPTTPKFTAKGQKQFTFHRKWVDEEDPLVFYWKTYDELYVATLLENWIEAIENRGPLENLMPVDTIKGATDAKLLTVWFKKNEVRLTNEEKCLYYGKLHRLEHGIKDQPNHQFLAEVQWWRDTSGDFVMHCPHCDMDITQGDLEKNSDD